MDRETDRLHQEWYLHYENVAMWQSCVNVITCELLALISVLNNRSAMNSRMPKREEGLSVVPVLLVLWTIRVMVWCRKWHDDFRSGEPRQIRHLWQMFVPVVCPILQFCNTRVWTRTWGYCGVGLGSSISKFSSNPLSVHHLPITLTALN